MRTPNAESVLQRASNEQHFLDAAERLLVEIGYADITARKLADEAGANLGLVHYYFGSMEELFVRVLERFTDQLVARQRAMYESPAPYIAKWRAAMSYLEDDRPYQKVWGELQAMGWNRPEFRTRIARVHDAWRDAMRASVEEALTRYQFDHHELSLDAWVTLIVTVNEGIILERLSGINRGHNELLAGIDRWLELNEQTAANARA